MKRYSLYLILLLAFVSGCKQDFDLTAPYQETPVVYGLLNSQETTHYIRIQKGFLIDGNAYNATGIADSIYYKDSLTVKLVPYLNGNPSGSAFTLTKVTLPKDSGLFAYDQNVLYKFTGNLDPNKRYKLEVTNNSNGNTFGTQKDMNNNEGVSLVKDFTVAVPAYKGFKMALRTANPAKVVWYTAQNGAIYDVIVRFPYKEYDAVSNTLLKDTFIDLIMVQSKQVDDVLGGVSISEEFSGTMLMNTLKNSLPSSNNIHREFNMAKGMTFYFAAGGEDLAKYINSQATQGAGLSSNEALPPYTNIKGGYGLLSSRFYKQLDSILLSNDAIDTLACNPLTSGLNFRKNNGQLCQ
jgi:hypothetical protein